MTKGTLSGKHALVTGGLGSIGTAFVAGLAAAGARVTVLDRPDLAPPRGHGWLGVDLNDLGSVEAKVSAAGPFDILINNAGLLVNKPFTELTREDFEDCYSVNVISVMETVQAALGKINSGHIVNISSMGGFQGSAKFPGLTAYSSAKAALCAFTEVFAEEYKDSSIKMNCLCLGAVQTKMLEKAFPGFKAEISPKEMGSYIYCFYRDNNNIF